MESLEDSKLLNSGDYETIIDDLKNGFEQGGIPFILPHMRAAGQDMMTTNPLPPELENPVSHDDPMQPPMLQLPPSLITKEEAVLEEETYIVSTIPAPQVSSTGTIPCLEEYPGPHNFDILLNSKTANKKSWVYSTELEKVFIDVDKSLVVNFKLSDFTSGLYVRALPVHALDDYVSVPVLRCNWHMFKDDPERKAHEGDPTVCRCDRRNLAHHVVRSTDYNVQYDYDRESNRHSVLVPVTTPSPGSDTFTVEYHFACKTSCPTGMNRKPINVVFTLETFKGEVIGRKIMPVKICSCPKRDMEKEEASFKENQVGSGKRRRSTTEKQANTKMLKTEISDVPSVEVSDIAALGIKMTQVQESITQMQANITKMESNIEKRLTKMEGNIEKRLTKMEGNISQMESKMEVLLNLNLLERADTKDPLDVMSGAYYC